MEIQSVASRLNSSQRRRERLQTERRSLTSVGTSYTHNLQFYRLPPTENLSLFEFENLAAERLKVLKIVESAGQRFVKGSNEYIDCLHNEFHQINYRLGLRGTRAQAETDEASVEDRRRDHISHFILRLAFCKTPDSRQWFLQQELDLFRFRFGLESSQSVNDFLRINQLDYELISCDGKGDTGDLFDKILASTPGLSCSRIKTTTYCKVPFAEAPSLVKCRRVYVERGFAYVLKNDLVSLISARFRSELSRGLTTASRYFGFMQEDDRIVPILGRLNSKAYIGKDFTNQDGKTDRVTPDMLDCLSKTSYPPCMRQLHGHLRANHHLKYGGRRQYGLFLKGIGLTLEDAMAFWKAEFCRKIDGDKFEKQYAYNIRYDYGKEGKRANFTPFSCAKIIMSNPPGPQDAHGCPFKHTDPQLLAQKLESMSLSAMQRNKIVDLAKKGQYDQACSRYFEFTHELPEHSLPQLIAHPNQYFEESRRSLNTDRATVLQGSQSERVFALYFEFTHDWPEHSLPQLIAHPNQYFEESGRSLNTDRATVLQGSQSESVDTQNSQVTLVFDDNNGNSQRQQEHLTDEDLESLDIDSLTQEFATQS